MCGKHGVHCNTSLGDGFHPSGCTTPAETPHMAGSAREPFGHSMCTSDAWRRRDSMDPELATSCVFDNEPWRHISNIVITSMFLLVAFGAPRSQAPGVYSEANTGGILSGRWQQCLAWLASDAWRHRDSMR